MSEEVGAARRQPLRRWALKLAWLVVPLALIGEFGHHLLDTLGQTLAHHFFHIVFGGGATLIFLAYVAIDVRRHGWPEFTWKIRPDRAERG